ncbi:MAG: lipocalin-like domain-containing protein [Burkholderiales bacterium]
MSQNKQARWLWIAGLMLGLLPTALHAQSLRDRLLGTWELVSWNYLTSGVEEPGPLGKDVTGYIMYTTDGHMCASAMIPDRKKFGTADFRAASDEEKARAFESFFGYCGKFEVNESDVTVTHLVEAGSVPNWMGTRQKRFVKISGEAMTLTTPLQTIGGRELVGVIAWKRAR